MKMTTIRITLGKIEELYEIGENEGYENIMQQFIDKHDVTDANEMTITEVGSFYDNNK